MQVDIFDVLNDVKNNNHKKMTARVNQAYLSRYSSINKPRIINIEYNINHFIITSENNILELYDDKIRVQNESDDWFFTLANILFLAYTKEVKQSIKCSYDEMFKNESICKIEDNYVVLSQNNYIYFYKDAYIKRVFAYKIDYDIEILQYN